MNTKRASTSRSISKKSWASTTAFTARRAVPPAPGPALASAPGSPLPTCTCLDASANQTKWPVSGVSSTSPARATRWSTRWAKTAASYRRCLFGYANTTTSTRPSFLASKRTTRGRPSRPSCRPAKRSSPPQVRATPTAPIRSHSARPKKRASSDSPSWAWVAKLHRRPSCGTARPAR